MLHIKRGLTLIELIIAMVAGFIVFMPLGMIMWSLYNGQEEINRLNEFYTGTKLVYSLFDDALPTSDRVAIGNDVGSTFGLAVPAGIDYNDGSDYYDDDQGRHYYDAGRAWICARIDNDLHIFWRSTDNKLYFARTSTTTYVGYEISSNCANFQFCWANSSQDLLQIEIELHNDIDDVDSKSIRKYLLRNKYR